MPDRADQVFIDERYVYLGSLGSGGMAQVLLARDTVLDREVAIKVLRGHYAEDPEFVERFRNEAQSAAALSHPNIVSVYDLGQSADSTYYIAMEYVEGGTLKERLDREGGLPESEAAVLGAQVADALWVAHQNGVIHRDIKPQNVLLTSTGEARVADFGIARAATVASGESGSGTGLVLGTASYMSPEQAAGETLGPRSDLYSLGVVLYEMLTGRLPFEAEGPVAVAFKQVYEEPRSPVELEPAVSGGMNDLVMRLLSKSPDDRHESAAEVSSELSELERLRDGEASTDAIPRASAPAGSGSATLPTAGGVRRGRRRFPLLPLGAVVLVAAVLLLWLGGGQPGGEAEVPDLIGVDVQEARQSLAESGLELGSVGEEAGAGAPRGEIVAQNPPPGATLQTGNTVDVTVSLGGSTPGNDSPSGGDPGGGFGGGGNSGSPGGPADQYSGSGN